MAGLDSTQTDGVMAFTALDEATNKLCTLGVLVLILFFLSTTTMFRKILRIL